SKPKPQPVNVVLRCYKTPDASLVAALAKVNGVADVEIDAEKCLLRAKLTGGAARLPALGEAASAAGVPIALLSPVRFSAWCSAKSKNIDLKALMEGAEKARGLTRVSFATAAAMEA